MTIINDSLQDPPTPDHDFILAFLDSKEYAPSTRETYQYVLTRLSLWLAERGQSLDTLTLTLYNEFVKLHKFSGNHRRLYGSALRAFYKWLGRPDHPIFCQSLPKDTAAPGRTLEPDSLEDLLRIFDPYSPLGVRNLAMICLMAETGLRASEVCRLEMSRLDMRHRRFSVLAKGQKWRDAVFSDSVAQLLQMWLDKRSEFALEEVGTVFVSIKGKHPGGRLTKDGLRALFRAFGERAQIGDFSPHDLRRTMATLLTESGAPSRLVQVMGGWDDIKMVERYTRRLKPGQIDRWTFLKESGALKEVVQPAPEPEPETQDILANRAERIELYLRTLSHLTKSARDQYQIDLERFAQWAAEQNILAWSSLTPANLLDYIDRQPWSYGKKNQVVSTIRNFAVWNNGESHPFVNVLSLSSLMGENHNGTATFTQQ